MSITTRKVTVLFMAEMAESRRFKYLDTAFYFFTKYTFFPLFKIYLQAERTGIKNIPRKGPFMIIANHASYMDPWFIGVMVRPRHIRYLTTTKWYGRSAAWKFFFDLYGCVPVTPEEIGPSSIKSVLRILKNGGAMAVFPEGRISDDGKMQEFKPGALYLAIRAGVTVIPVAICGSYEILSRKDSWPKPRKLRIVVGEPIEIARLAEEVNDPKELCVRETQRIKDWIADQLRQFEEREQPRRKR